MRAIPRKRDATKRSGFADTLPAGLEQRAINWVRILTPAEIGDDEHLGVLVRDPAVEFRWLVSL